MKIPTVLSCFLFPSVLAAAAKKNFAVPQGNRAVFLPTTSRRTSTPSALVNAALNVRGGGGGGDMKDTALQAYSAILLIHASVSSLAPEAVPKILYGNTFSIEEGTLGHMIHEDTGLTCLSMVLMTHLTKDTDLAASNVVAYAVLPCTAWLLRHSLKGSFDKFGFAKGLGPLSVILNLVLFSLIHLQKGNEELYAKILLAIPTAMGVVCWFFPDLYCTIAGGIKPENDTDKTLLKWWSGALIQAGILGAALLNGVDLHKAVGYASAFFFVELFDNNFVRKANDRVNLTAVSKYGFTLFTGLIAFALLKPAVETIAEQVV